MINLKDLSFGGQSRMAPITKQPSFANLEGGKRVAKKGGVVRRQ